MIDEYNLIQDQETSRLMAETIKALSDAGVKATIFIVGISDSVRNLVSGHELSSAVPRKSLCREWSRKKSAMFWKAAFGVSE